MTNDGGPIYPGTDQNGLNSGVPGMSLRQHYAGLAMQAEVSSCSADRGLSLGITDTQLRVLATHWVRIADALIQAEKAFGKLGNAVKEAQDAGWGGHHKSKRSRPANH